MKKKDNIRIASLSGILGNLLLLIIKGCAGIISNSHAMIADATNSASDIFASLMAFIGNKIAVEPADDDHNLGHGKAEYIFSLFIGISMVIASIIVIINSIKDLFNATIFNISNYLIIICLVTILIKLSLYIYTKIVYKKEKSILLKSLYKDHRNDCVITMGTLVSVIFSFFDVYWLDSVVGIIICCWIIYTGFKIIVESYDVLMDQSIDDESKEQIESIICNFSKGIKMGTMSSIPIGYKYIIVLTIYVDGNMTTTEAHQITKELQYKIKKKIKIIDRVVIHVNPIK